MVLRRPFWLTVGVIAISVFLTWYSATYSLFPQARTIFLRLSTLAILFLLVNWVLTLISVRKLIVNRTQRLRRLQVGNVFEEVFEVLNPIHLSRIWVEIEDLSTLPGKKGSKVLAGIGGKKNRYYFSRTILTSRGAFQLGPTLIRSGDPFGMFVSEKIIPDEEELVVLPHIIDIAKFYEPVGYLQGGKSIKQKSLEATSFASGIREYQPGDPLNRIHWKYSAKKNKFMVKEFDQDPQADIWIIIDGFEKNNFQESHDDYLDFADSFWAFKKKTAYRFPKSTFEYSVGCAASLSAYFIKNQKSVGLACADQKLTVISPEKGSRQEIKLLETMAFLRGIGAIPLNEVIESLGNQVVRGSTVVIISAAEYPEIQLCVEILLRRKLRPVIIQINKDSFINTESKQTGKLLSINIPNTIINYGDDITVSLQSVLN